MNGGCRCYTGPAEHERPHRERREYGILLAIFAVVAAWSAIRPYDVADYLLELATPLGGAVLPVTRAHDRTLRGT